MTRSLLLALASALVAVALVVPVVSAGGPIKTTEPFSVFLDRPAGTICDFELAETFTGTDVVKEFSDRVQIHETVSIVHTNVDTGYTLTDTYVTNYTYRPDGSLKVTGLIWHLRDASGKLVVVEAGQIIYGPDGDMIKHTPGITPNGREVICPALGGDAIPH